jgi:hypothetical protein
MIGDDQVEFLRVRDRGSGGVLDPLGCRIRETRERVHVIVKSGPPPRPIRR